MKDYLEAWELIKMNDLVSIIIPTYNRGKKLQRAVDSVLNQSYQYIEVIVVDDCSTDDTAILMENYRNDKRVTYYRLEKNSGACAARNKGIELSKGNYIGFLDSDDMFLPDKIRMQMDCLFENNSDLCAGNFIRIDERGKRREVLVKNLQGKAFFNELLYCNFITTGTLIGKKECFNNIQFDETLPRYQDWDIVLRLAKKYSFCFVEEPLIEQEHQKESITASTGYEKTTKALLKIYYKFSEDYEQTRKARSQIHWLIGRNSGMSQEKTRFKDLWIGMTANGFNIKRFIIFIYILLFKNSKHKVS